MSSPYAKIPLLQPDKQIRLLRLEPSASDSDDFCFSLAVHEFHDNARPSYVGISYTWGDAVPLLPIVVNGTKMRVRFNCWYALWQIRHHGFTEYLWIDSLCINQDNDEEKNSQVAIMGSIYESALWVASCIGTGETIGLIQSILTSDGEEAKRSRMKLREKFDQIPYFDRVWIKQEIILARDIRLFCGQQMISWEQFDSLINTDQRLGQSEQHVGSEGVSDFDLLNDTDDTEDSSYYDRLNRRQEMPQPELNSTTLQLCNHRMKSESGTFVDLILRYQTAKATNSRDKVYALLSLLPKEDLIRQSLVIDYAQPTFYLFHAIVRLIYSTYEDSEYGQKYQALHLVREWLDIDENNIEMDDYLRLSPFELLDRLLYSTPDLSGPQLTGVDPRVMLDIVEMQQIKEDLASHIRFMCDEYTPLLHSKLMNYFRRNDQQWTEESFDQPVPTNLKAKLFILIKEGTDGDPHRSEQFVVNADVGAGDFIAKIGWELPEHIHHNTHRLTVAHAVLRSIRGMCVKEGRIDDSVMDTSDDISIGSSDSPPEQENETETYLKLHSWAIPMNQDFSLLTSVDDSEFPYQYQQENLGILELHHRDALIPLILNDKPLHALMYPAPEGSYFSRVRSDNDGEYLNRQRRRPSRSSIEIDADYLRDVLG